MRTLLLVLVMVSVASAVCDTIMVDSTLTQGIKISGPRTIYMKGNLTTSSYACTLDVTNGSLYFKTSGTKGIIQNGTGTILEIGGSTTNRVYFTSKNDTLLGDKIAGATGSPAYTDQSKPYISSTGTGSLLLNYFTVYYNNAATGSAVSGAIVYSNSANQLTKKFICKNFVFRYCYCGTTSSYNLCVLGYSSSAFYKIDSMVIADGVIDSTNHLIGGGSPGNMLIMGAANVANLYNCTIVTGNNNSTLGQAVVASYADTSNLLIKNCVIGGSSGKLLYIGSYAGPTTNIIRNCIIIAYSTNVTGVYLRKFSGATAPVDTITDCIIMNCNKGIDTAGVVTYFEDYNNFYNNTSNSKTSLGAHSHTVNPNYGINHSTTINTTTPVGSVHHQITNEGWANPELLSVAYGLGKYVAVTHSNIDYHAMHSTDGGKTWTWDSVPGDPKLYKVVFANNKFVACATNGRSKNRIVTSTDGINWTLQTTPDSSNYYGLCYGDSGWVASSLNGNVMRSSDAITWQMGTSAYAGRWHNVAFGNGVYVCMSDIDEHAQTSTNSLSWVSRNNGSSATKWHGFTFGGGKFVAVAEDRTSRVNVSSDGINWKLYNGQEKDWLDVAYGQGTFVACAQSSSSTQNVMTSKDDSTWTLRTTPGQYLHGLVYGDSGWIVVAYNGNENRISKSTDTGQTWTQIRSPTYCKTMFDYYWIPYNDTLIGHGSRTYSDAGFSIDNYSLNGYKHKTTDTITPGILYYFDALVDTFAPTITSQPSSATVTTPATNNFTVTATGTGTLSYQWYKNDGSWSAVSGATASSYTTPATSSAMNGYKYYVSVTDVNGTKNSDSTATLTVYYSPSISVQPSSATVTAPTTQAFSVTASGNPAVSYQWKKDGANVGTNSNSYTTPATTSAYNGAVYTCVISNSAGTVTTNNATLTVITAPFETGDMLGGAYVDTHTIDTVVLSTFTHYGAGQEWSKYSGSDTAYDTTWAGATAVKIKSTNFTGMKIVKTFASPKDFSSYNRFRLNCSFTARDSLVYIYLSTNNFTGYAYRSCKPSLTQVSVNETFTLSFDRPDFAVGGSGFSWSNVDKIRVDFQAGSGHTNYMTVWKLSAEKSTLSKAVLMLTFDDGHVSVFDNARSILSIRGIKAAISTCTGPAFMADSTNYLNLRKLDSLKADGNIIVNHGKTHTNLNTINLDSVRKELAYSDSFIIANNLDTKGKIHIYPYGGAADSVRGVASSYLSLGFSTETWPTKYVNVPTRDRLLIPRYLVGNSETVKSAKTPLDSAVIYKYPVVYGFHAISNSTSYGSKWAADSFSIFCDSVKAKVDAGVLDVKLPTQYYTWRKDTTVNDGSNFTFRVSYGGTTPSYQWQKNGSNITGATTSSYTAASQYALDNGAVYRCVVSNSAGTVTSSNAILTVNESPVISLMKYSMGRIGFIDTTLGSGFGVGGGNIELFGTVSTPVTILYQTDDSLIWTVPNKNKGTFYWIYTNSNGLKDTALFRVLVPGKGTTKP